MSARLKSRLGFTLVELMIVVLLSGLMAGGLIWQKSMDYKRKRGIALGDQLHVINEATQSYITKNYGALVSAVPVVPGFAAPLQPTTAELRAAGILSASVGDTNVCGSGYTIIISKVPSGCISPNCDLQSLTMTSAPVYYTGTTTIDAITLSSAATEIGGNAGVALTPPTFEGIGGAWSAANPLATAGILTEKFSYASSDLAGFLKTDGTNQMLAALNVGGNDVNNAKNVNASGNVTAGGNVSATGTVSGSTVNSSGNMTATGTVTGGTVNSTGNMTAAGTVQGNTDVRGPKFIDSNNTAYYVDPAGNSNIGDMTLNTVVVAGNACAPNGRVARDATGLLLSCQSGVWKKASGSTGFNGVFTVAYTGGCQAVNFLTGACSCPAGSTASLAGTFYMNGFWSSQPDHLYACY